MTVQSLPPEEDDHGCTCVEIGIGAFRSSPPKIITLQQLKKQKLEEGVEAYSSVYRFQTDDPYVGLIVSRLLFDLDSNDLEEARQEAIKLIDFLTKKWKIPEEAFSICFSGAKGFHIFVNRHVFGTLPHEKLNVIWRFIAERLKSSLALSTLDLSVYDRRRMVRLENTINKRSGLYKIPLTLRELDSLSIEEIKKLAIKPRYLDNAPQSTITSVPEASEVYAAVLDQLTSLENRYAKSQPIRTVSSLSELPRWVQGRLATPVGAGLRNNTIFSIGVALAQYGIPEGTAVTILQEYDSHCNPPLNQNEIRAIQRSAYSGVSKGKYSVSPYSDAFVEFAESVEEREFLVGDTPVLRAAGGLHPFIYEPLGASWYLWLKDDQKRGIIKATFDPDRKGYYIKIDDGEYRFREAPLEVLPWSVPPREQVLDFLANKRSIMTGAELFVHLRKYFETFVDLPQTWHSTVLALTVFQSYLRDLLRTSIFYITFASSFGGGKTTALEAVNEVFHHGLMGSSVSDASQGRIGEFYSANWTLDEYDELAGEASQALSRVGYRPGAQYIRWNADSGKPDISDPYAVRVFTIHSEHEAALKTRSLTYIELVRSSDHRIPVINKHRKDLSRGLASELFFWRLDFLSKHVKGDSGDPGDEQKWGLPEDWKTLDVDRIRDLIHGKHVGNLHSSELKLLESLQGRDAELVSTALEVARMIDAPEIVEDLIAAVNQKRLEEVGEQEVRFLKLLEIVKRYIDDSNTQLGKTEIRLPEVTGELTSWCKETGQKNPAAVTLSSWYRKLGIVKGINVRHRRDGNYLVLDKRVADSIKGIEEFTELRLENFAQNKLEQKTLSENLDAESKSSEERK